MLTKEQKALCKYWLQLHRHKDYATDIRLTKDLTLKGFKVNAGVFRPESTSGLLLARFLANNPQHYKGNSVLDMCCGSGIQGITMMKNGASFVDFSDIDEMAVKNTGENLNHFGITRTVVYHGDLFEEIFGKYDLIVCNHPFWNQRYDRKKPITRCWFDSGTLIRRFLEQAPNFLYDHGHIIMPFFESAGEVNNPRVQGPKYGYNVERIHEKIVDVGKTARGVFSVYLLQKHFS